MVILHPSLTHAQAERVLRDIGAKAHLTTSGNVRVEFTPCDGCRSVLCAEFEFCAKSTPTPPNSPQEAA